MVCMLYAEFLLHYYTYMQMIMVTYSTLKQEGDEEELKTCSGVQVFCVSPVGMHKLLSPSTLLASTLHRHVRPSVCLTQLVDSLYPMGGIIYCLTEVSLDCSFSFLSRLNELN